MKRMFTLLLLLCALCGAVSAEEAITPGTQSQRGFLNDNVLHSDIGDIHFSSYIPESYDGSEPYALFVTLPGWEGLYFQGVGANMVEDFGAGSHCADRILPPPLPYRPSPRLPYGMSGGGERNFSCAVTSACLFKSQNTVCVAYLWLSRR